MPVFLMDPCQNGLQPLKTQTILPTSTAISISSNAMAGVFLGRFTNRQQVPGTTVLEDLMLYNSRNTSTANAALTVNFDCRGLNQVLAINMTTSGGTATLTLSVTTDGTNFITVDSIAAAAATAKNYSAGTLGATTGISPLAFQTIKVVAGAAGVGNTTTLDIAMK